MKSKPKAAGGKDKPKAKKLSIHKDTVQSLSDDDLGQVQGGKGANTAAACSSPCPVTKVLCVQKTTVSSSVR